MGIFDKVTALLPKRGEREERSERDDVLALKDDIDRWFQHALEDPFGATSARWMPSVDVHETDREVVVTMEVAGLDSDNLDLRITPQGLVVRGEKVEEKEDGRRDFHVLERSYGRFLRTVPLQPGLDVERAEAKIKKGVLTVRLPKAGESAGRRRIPVRA
jgi:HSP20 family protein